MNEIYFAEEPGFHETLSIAVDKHGLKYICKITECPRYAVLRWYEKKNRPATFIQKHVLEVLKKVS